MANDNLFFFVSGCARQEDNGGKLSMEQGKVKSVPLHGAAAAEAGQNLGP
jgi:hypothetical protein